MGWIEKIWRIFSKREKAIIKSDDGTTINIVDIKPKQLIFEYDKRSYNVIRDKNKYERIDGIWFEYYYYHYNVNNPMPLEFTSNGWIPTIDSELYDRLLENKVLLDLNTIKKGLLDGIDFKMIIIVIVIIAAAIYFLNGGKLV